MFQIIIIITNCSLCYTTYHNFEYHSDVAIHTHVHKQKQCPYKLSYIPYHTVCKESSDIAIYTNRTHLTEFVSHHVSDSPWLVLGCWAKCGHNELFYVILLQSACNECTRLHCQKTNRVLERKRQGDTLMDSVNHTILLYVMHVRLYVSQSDFCF